MIVVTTQHEEYLRRFLVPELVNAIVRRGWTSTYTPHQQEDRTVFCWDIQDELFMIKLAASQIQCYHVTIIDK